MSIIHIPARSEKCPFASMKGHHVAVRVPEFGAGRRWYVEKLDFHVVHEWPYADQHLVYLAPATDDSFFIELLGDGQARRSYPKTRFGPEAAARGRIVASPQADIQLEVSV